MNILGIHLKSFLDYASLRSVPEKAALAFRKQLPADENLSEALIDEKIIYRTVADIYQALADDYLGLRVGEQLNLNTMGVIYRISLKTATMEEAIYYCQSYLSNTFPRIKTLNLISNRRHTISLTLDAGSEIVSRIILETTLTVVAREIVLLAGEAALIRITSPYCDKNYSGKWKKGKAFEVVFHQSVLKQANRDFTSLGFGLLVPQYLSMIGRMSPRRSFQNKVKIMMLNMAGPQLPGQENMARALSMNVRALQRRLEQEGITYRRLTDNLKKEISDLLIRHRQLSVTDISAMLNFSEPAAFIRAFKKWHYQSPARYRDGLKVK